MQIITNKFGRISYQINMINGINTNSDVHMNTLNNINNINKKHVMLPFISRNNINDV